MTGLSITISLTVVLVIFYLAVLFRPNLMCRKGCYLIGAGALLLAVLLVGFFSTFVGLTNRGNPNWAAILCGILSAVLNTVALGSGITALYPGKVPMESLDDRVSSAISGEKPPVPAQQQGEGEGGA